MVETTPALLTVEEAARLLRVGRTKAYAMTQQWHATGGAAGLPVVDFGNVLRVPRHALEDIIGAPIADGELDAASPVEPEQAVDVSEPAPDEASKELAVDVVAPPRSAGRRRRRRAVPAAQAALFDA